MFLHHPPPMLLVGTEIKYGLLVIIITCPHGKPLPPTLALATILDGMKLVRVEVLRDFLGQDTKYMKEKKEKPR